MPDMPKQKWINIRIPEGSEPYKVIKKGGDGPAWKSLAKKLEEQPESKYDKASKIVERFINDLDIIVPGSKRKLEYLVPIILNKILGLHDPEYGVYKEYKELDDTYFDKLKNWLNDKF